MENVWVVKHNGEQTQETFLGAEEAINYAKQSSLRALCSIRTQGDIAVFYEYGEQVDANRTRELNEAVIEIINGENERYAKGFRGRAVRRKV